MPHIVSEEEALEEKKKKLIEKKSHERRRRRSIFRNKPIVGETHEPSHRDQ